MNRTKNMKNLLPAPSQTALRKLGFSSYRAYLKSPHWQQVRDLYRLAGLPQNCACGKPPAVLHHRHYELLGREWEDLACLQPVCRGCHKLLHGHERNPRPLAGRAFRLKDQ